MVALLNMCKPVHTGKQSVLNKQDVIKRADAIYSKNEISKN